MTSEAERGISRILVLGGSGFIGAAVVRALAGRPQVRVRAAARTAPTSDDPTVEAIRCDVLDPAALAATLADVDVVLNCCRERKDEQAAGRFIDALLRGVETAGVRHLVFMSSIAVYGAATGAVREDSAAVEPLNWYGRAKRHAEDASRGRASDRLAITILRPALVYGPGGEEWSLDFIRSIRRGHLTGLGASGEGQANLVHVDDLATFCAALAIRPASGAVTYTVTGTEPITFNAYFAGIAAALRDAGITVMPPRRPPLLGAYARPLLRRGLEKIAASRFAAARHALRHRPEDRTGARYAADTRYLPDRAVAAGFVAALPIAERTRQAVAWAIANRRI